MTERAQFEKWYEEHYHRIAANSSWVERAWAVWQAARASVPERPQQQTMCSADIGKVTVLNFLNTVSPRDAFPINNTETVALLERFHDYRAAGEERLREALAKIHKLADEYHCSDCDPNTMRDIQELAEAALRPADKGGL